MLYQVETREKEYASTLFQKNILNMDEKKFGAFLRAIRISEDYDGHYFFEFNSGIRHKYCLVVTITRGTEILYDKGTGYISKNFLKRIQKEVATREDVSEEDLSESNIGA